MNEKNEIKLRLINETDALILMELNNNEDVARYVVGNPLKVSLEQQLQWMSKLKKETNAKRWMIDFNEQTVGTIILSSIDFNNKTGNMNIKLLPDFQGKGIAIRALRQACDFAFDEIDLYCLTANILSYNTKSRSLFQKLGFKQDGILRSRVIKNNERFDLISLSLLKDERLVEE